jgi:hypothetical protein
VRQLVDGGGNVTLARNFEPFGSLLESAGTGSTVMSFTGETLGHGNRADVFEGEVFFEFHRALFDSGYIERQLRNALDSQQIPICLRQQLTTSATSQSTGSRAVLRILYLVQRRILDRVNATQNRASLEFFNSMLVN